MKSPIKVIGLLLTLAATLSFGQAPITKKAYQEKVEGFINQTLKEIGSVPGVSIAVVKGDQIFYEGGFGFANKEKGLKMDENTSFYIASITKSFTGLLAAILDEEGILSLDGTLKQYLPDVPFKEFVKADEIKLRDLLTHSAGIDHPSIGFRLAYTGDHDHDILMDLMQHLGTNEAGKGVYNYTNLGYNVYTIILEEVTGKPWQEWLEEKIFNPMGMNRTTAYMSRAHKNNWPLAQPYMGLSDEDIRSVYLMKKDNTMQSAGGLITNASDAARWMKMQLNNGQLEGKQVFAEKLILKARRSLIKVSDDRGRFQQVGYGLGQSIGDFDGRKVIWHSGGFPGYLSTISYMPEENLGVAVFVNEGMAGFPLMHIFMDYAYDAYLQPNGWEQKYEDMKNDFFQQLKERRTRIQTDIKKRKAREWNLSHSFKHYSGTFVNEIVGKIKVKGNKDQISVRMGNLYCTATPFPEKDTIRVELVPFRGNVLQFVLEEDQVVALRLNGNEFKKR